MAGTMREKSSGVWELRVQAGRDPLSGKYRQKSKTFHGSKPAASKALAKMVVEAEEAGPNASSATFSALLEKWLTLRSPGMSPLTVARYRIAIDKHIVPALGDRQVRRLKTEDFDVFYAALGASMKPASVRKIHNVCSAALKQAVKWGWIARNVTEDTNKPKLDKWNHQLPDMEDVKKLLERAMLSDPALGRLLWVKLAIGARRGEMLGLRRSDIKWDDKLVTIQQQVIQHPTGELEARKTKWDSRRVLAVDDATLTVLRAQCDAMDARGKVAKDAFVWSDRDDCSVPWRPNRVTLAFIRLARPTPVPKGEAITDEEEAARWKGVKIRLHDLRHLNGSHLSNLGVDIATVSKRLGHSRISTTADFYLQAVSESDKAAGSALSDLLRLSE